MYMRALQDSNSTNTTFPMVEEEEEDVGADLSLEFTFVTALVVVVFFILCVREYYVRRYGVDFCPVFHLFPARQAQVDRDREYAEEVQRQLDLENHEAELEAKRKERKEWYEAFVVPYTMTVEENDFFYAQETDKNGNTILKGNPAPSSRKYSSTSSVDMEEELMEEGIKKSNKEGQPSDNEDEEVDEEVFLRLPIRDGVGNCRTVEANCTICFSEYQAGDRVIWSELRCKHAFHYDCILPWLIKGKKRCPICRDWFVPGAKIEDQKKALVERLARERAMLSTADGMNETDLQEGDENDVALHDSSPSEALSLERDDVDAMAGLKNPAECNHSTTSKNQHSFEKQLSSSSEQGEDETTIFNCPCHDIPASSVRVECISTEERAGSEAVLATNGGTEESSQETQSNSGEAVDLERQNVRENDGNTIAIGGSPDPRTILQPLDEQDVDQLMDGSPPDDESLSSQLSETQELSA